MPELTIELLALIFFITLIAEIFGSIFGGGGLLIQPAMLLMGFPPHIIIANDTSACTGTALSGAYVFRKGKYVAWNILKWWIPGMIIGPFIGVQLLVITPVWVIEKFITLICVIGSAYVLLSSKSKNKSTTKDNNKNHLPANWKLRAIISSICIGAYFGFSSAGGGTLTSLILYTLFGLNMHTTLGTRKFIHVPFHIISAALYYTNGLIIWPLCLTMFSACLIAGWIGSNIAIKMPEHILRPLFFTVILCLAFLTLIK